MSTEKHHRFSLATDQDGAAILDVDRGLFSTLNPTGAYVWQRLEQGQTVDCIISSLARDTSTDVIVIDRDVRAFVEDLRKNQLFPE